VLNQCPGFQIEGVAPRFSSESRKYPVRNSSSQTRVPREARKIPKLLRMSILQTT